MRETGTGALTGVDKKADDHQKYRRYREELDGAVDERKDDGEQQIVTLEESTCTESEPELDANAIGSSKAAEPEEDTPKSKSKGKGVIMSEYKLNWSPVAETAIRYGGSAEFVQEILVENAKVTGSSLGTVPVASTIFRSTKKAIHNRRDQALQRVRGDMLCVQFNL